MAGGEGQGCLKHSRRLQEEGAAPPANILISICSDILQVFVESSDRALADLLHILGTQTPSHVRRDPCGCG